MVLNKPPINPIGLVVGGLSAYSNDQSPSGTGLQGLRVSDQSSLVLLCPSVSAPGALDGGPQCRLSILRNGNVPCHYFLNVPVDFKIV